MVRLTMSDDSGKDSYERASTFWDRISHALGPEIEDLSEEDQRYYRKVKFLIDKEPKLANYPRNYLYYFIRLARNVFTLSYYPMVISDEYLRRKLAEYVNTTSSTLAVDGLAWKFGPMGFQQQKIVQEVVGIPQQTGGR